MTGGGMPLPCQREHACGHYKGEKKRLKKGMGARTFARLYARECMQWSGRIYLLLLVSSTYHLCLRLLAPFFVFTAAPSEARAASDSCESVKEYMTRFHSCYITLLGRG